MNKSRFLWGLVLSSFLTSCSNVDTSEEQGSEVNNGAQVSESESTTSGSTISPTLVSNGGDENYALIKEFTERLENQEKVDAQIQAEVESGYYTPENPLVILDPYTQSPLTALICFVTEEPTKVHIHIEGEDEYTEVNHSFEELTTQHIIPVYGLYPDKLNPVTISVFDENGELISENVTEIQTEPVSDHFQSLIILTETFQEGYSEGINYRSHTGQSAFDKNGDFRWYFTDVSYTPIVDLNYLNNRFIMAKGQMAPQGDAILFELDKLGKIYAVYYTDFGVHHEITHMPDGTLLLGGSNETTHSDAMYDIDTTTGETRGGIDFRTILQRSRPAWGINDFIGLSNRTDWMHLNSIEYNETDSTVLVSSNFQSAVIKMEWPSGDIHWILGNHDHWNPRLEAYLLSPVGSGFEWSYNQHAAMFLPDYDNDPDTVDVLLFDNGTTRFEQDLELQRQIENNEIVTPEKYSRLVHYRINERTMEVEQIWQYGKERGLELFSTSTGYADLLSNGNMYGMFQHDIQLENGTVSIFPVLLEVNTETGLVWEAELLKTTNDGRKDEYRAERLPFYFVDDAYHNIHGVARNLIPEDVMVSALGGEYLIKVGAVELKELFHHDSISADKTPDNLLIYREEFEIKADSYYQLSFSLSDQDISSIERINIDLYDGPTYDFAVNEVRVDDVTERVEVLLSSTDTSGVSDGTAQVRIMIQVKNDQESMTLTDVSFGKWE